MQETRGRLNILVAVLVLFSIVGLTIISLSTRSQQSLDSRSQASTQETDLVAEQVRPANDCVVTGCSSQLCVDARVAPVYTTCEWREEYACYRDVACERQPTGECGFSPTDTLIACLAEAGVEPEYPPVVINPAGLPGCTIQEVQCVQAPCYPEIRCEGYTLESSTDEVIVLDNRGFPYGYGINAILKWNGDIVLDQSSVQYTWTQTDPSVIDISNTMEGSAGECPYNINPPCPNSHADLTALSPGTTTITAMAYFEHPVPAEEESEIVPIPITILGETTFTVTVREIIDPPIIIPPGDFNYDGRVDDADYDIIVAEMASQPTVPKADMNRDGVVNVRDYTLFVIEYIKADTIYERQQ